MSGAAAMFLRRASKLFHSPMPFKSPDGPAFNLSRAKLQPFSSAPSVGVTNPEQDVARGQEKLEVVNAGEDKSADAPPVLLNVVIPVVAVLPKTEPPKTESLMAEPPKAEAPSAVQGLSKEAPAAAEPASEKKHKARRKTYESKYLYGRIRLEPDDSLLKQPKGAETMKKLGLDAFLNAKIPDLNPELCDEFLSTYKDHDGHGVVQGLKIVITPEAIHKVTGLPLGIKPISRLSKDECEALKSFATLRHSDTHCLESLKLGDDSEVISAAGRLLMQKMRSKRHGSGTVTSQILLGLQSSLQSNVQPQWAAYMAEHIRRASSLTHAKNRRFYFGGWLSGLIENALPEGQVKKAPAAAEKNGKELKKRKPRGVKKEKAEKTAVVVA